MVYCKRERNSINISLKKTALAFNWIQILSKSFEFPQIEEEGKRRIINGFH